MHSFDRYGHLFPQELADLATSLAELRADPDAFGAAATEHAVPNELRRQMTDQLAIMVAPYREVPNRP